MSFPIEMKKSCVGNFRCALFDFDGTISLIREGWQDIMIPYFCEVLSAVEKDQAQSAIYAEVKEFVDRLTGKQTIYQCMALADAVSARGATPLSPGAYKAEYLRRLNERIKDRKQRLADKTAAPEAYAVKGALQFVRKLKTHGIRCFLASGTDEPDVVYEAGLLGIADAFDGGIYGAKESLTDCSKEAVIKNLLESKAVAPTDLLGFGDGFVEIELVSSAGGFAVGVATDEKKKDQIDQNKRKRLIDAGAGMIIPDFSDPDAILQALGVL